MLGIMHARILARGYVARYTCECYERMRTCMCVRVYGRARPHKWPCNGNPKTMDDPADSNDRVLSLPRFIVCLRLKNDT